MPKTKQKRGGANLTKNGAGSNGAVVEDTTQALPVINPEQTPVSGSNNTQKSPAKINTTVKNGETPINKPAEIPAKNGETPVNKPVEVPAGASTNQAAVTELNTASAEASMNKTAAATTNQTGGYKKSKRNNKKKMKKNKSKRNTKQKNKKSKK